MKGALSFLTALIVATSAFAQAPLSQFTEHGELIVTRLSSAPFPHPKRSAGHAYEARLYSTDQHYRDSSVAIFIPKGYRQTGVVDLIVHFHGWWNNIDTTLNRYELPQQLVESGKNAILVVPEGPRNAPDSFGGKLEDVGGFQRFISEVIDLLYRQSKIKTRAVGTVILSGHSGGFRVISFILMRGGMPERIKEVYLFDALYGQVEKYVHWLDRYQGRLVTIYTDSGGTKEETEALMEDLAGWEIPFVARREVDLTANDLRSSRLVFIHTDLGHDAVMHARRQFQQYLHTSCLAVR